MKVTDFAVEVAKLEGKKIELPIGQIKEVLKCVNILTDGELYSYIKNCIK